MINIRSIRKLKDDDGLTLRAGKKIVYMTGYQVATEGVKCTSAQEAIKAVKQYNGNCGIWYSNGIYYVDKSQRVATKKEALKIGREHNQISILSWRNMGLVYC